MQGMDKITILDFGGQYTQLLARRVREMGVFCEILPGDKPISAFEDEGLRGVILTGGTSAPDAGNAPDTKLFGLGVPVLGIGYGMLLIEQALGLAIRELGAPLQGAFALDTSHGALLQGISTGAMVAMDLHYAADGRPEGFSCDASLEGLPNLAISSKERALYGLAFHPELGGTENGRDILRNFVFGVCEAQANYSLQQQIGRMVDEVRAQVGDGKVVSALSGGVDSSVASVIADRALQKGQLTCVFVDHGLLRLHEAEEVMQTYRDNLGLEVIHVDAAERFLQALAGVTDPEQKRKVIGETFIRVFEEHARQIGAQFLLQGTIYPDIIESGIGGQTIKSHHNVGGLPKESLFQKEQLVEPLKLLFKDEVRRVGEQLGIPHDMLWRQPFPGPGLGVRCIGELKKERLDTLRLCDWIYREEIKNAGLDQTIWQYFAVSTGIRTVGVSHDARTYADCIALRAVITEDAMTAQIAQIPYPVLDRIVQRIIKEVPGVNRVVYDITAKPPGTIEWE